MQKIMQPMTMVKIGASLIDSNSPGIAAVTQLELTKKAAPAPVSANPSTLNKTKCIHREMYGKYLFARQISILKEQETNQE